MARLEETPSGWGPVWLGTPSGRGPRCASAKLRREFPTSTSTLFHVQRSSLAPPHATMVDIRRSSRLNPSAPSRSPSPPPPPPKRGRTSHRGGRPAASGNKEKGDVGGHADASDVDMQDASVDAAPADKKSGKLFLTTMTRRTGSARDPSGTDGLRGRCYEAGKEQT